MTARDQAVLDLLLEGCDNREISERLHIAERTVKAHFGKMFRKRGITKGIKRVKLAVMEMERILNETPGGKDDGKGNPAHA
jgi:DNA-binding NarL/FixJ family response regulator